MTSTQTLGDPAGAPSLLTPEAKEAAPRAGSDGGALGPLLAEVLTEATKVVERYPGGVEPLASALQAFNGAIVTVATRELQTLLVRSAFVQCAVEPPRCRRCVECEGAHHFSDAMRVDNSDAYLCKHCPATTPACEDCGEAVPFGFRLGESPALCPDCLQLDEQNNHEELEDAKDEARARFYEPDGDDGDDAQERP